MLNSISTCIYEHYYKTNQTNQRQTAGRLFTSDLFEVKRNAKSIDLYNNINRLIVPSALSKEVSQEMMSAK